jgi:aspartate 1-decarboxylase
MKTFCYAKLHRARVTATKLEYDGSITIDSDYLDRLGMHPYEQVQVANISNGYRFLTYILPGQSGSGSIEVNGAAARNCEVGDLLIVMAYCQMQTPPGPEWAPEVLLLGGSNGADA